MYINGSEIFTDDNSPVSFPHGIMIGRSTGAGTVNNIGVMGQQGAGVGIAPYLPDGFAKLYGTEDPASDTYGNYQYTEGSIMCYEPHFVYKYGTGSNGLALNEIDIKPFTYFENSLTIANAAGYAMHRAFYNGGAIRPGFMYDKYKCSLNGNVASSIKNGIVLTSAQRGSLATAVFSSCTGNSQTPSNNFLGAIAAAKSRGNQFFPHTQFMRGALALVSNAHGAAAVGQTYCGWYDAAGITNFPKGNNNNALGDANDATIAYLADGNGTYPGCGKTGSANFFSKTTHNGQNCGVADLNGLVWDIEPFGITSDGTSFFLLNTAVDVTTITSGNTLATDAWGATGLAAMYTNIGATYESLTASSTNKTFGSASQVLSAATSGTAWGMAGAGIPLVTGVGGSNKFGNDYMYDARPNELCVMGGAAWPDSLIAGPWARNLATVRSTSAYHFGFSSACFL
jgi:hypothetical protein